MNLYIISGVYHLYKWTKISLLNLRHILTRGTISLRQKTKESLLALAWRELTTNREHYQARLNITEVRRKKTKSKRLCLYEHF